MTPNTNDPAFMRRVLAALGSNLLMFGRPHSGDEVCFARLEPEEGFHPHRPRYQVPIKTGGEWFLARLIFHTDRDEAVLVRPGARSLDALDALHRSMPLPPPPEAAGSTFQPLARS